MATLAEIRQQHPEYNDLSDDDLAGKLHAKFYADMPREEFNKRVGYVPQDIADVRREPSMLTKTREAISGLTEQAKQGATFGFADEIQAAMDAGIQGGKNLAGAAARGVGFDVKPGLSMGERYDQSLAQQRAGLRQFSEDHPILSTGAQIAGGFAVPVTGGIKALDALAQVPKMGAFGRAALTGAGAGALYGYGAGEGGTGERASSAAQGALFGGLAGIGGELVGRGLSALGRVKNELLPADVNETAMAKIGRALERDKVDSAAFAQKLKESPELIPAAAAGRNTKALADVVVTRPGESGQRADTLAKAIADKADDVAKREIAAGLGTQGEFYQTLDQLGKAKRQAAQPLYERAYAAEGNVWNDDLAKLAERPSVKEAMQKAFKIAAEEDIDPRALGLDFNEAGDVIFVKVPSMRTLDYIKRGLDDVVEGYRDATTGKLVLDTYGGAANNTRSAWVRALDDANPDYRAARDAWSGPTRQQAAMREGEEFLTMRPEEIATRLKELGADERQFFRMGIERRLMDVIDNAPDGADIFKRLIGNDRKRAQLKEAFQSPADYTAFIKRAQDRIESFNTLSKVRGGSPTAPRQAAMEDFSGGAGMVGDAIVQGALGERVGAAKTLARGVMSRIRAPREDVANAVGSRLLPTNDLERAAFIDRLINGPAPTTRALPGTMETMFTQPRMRAGLSAIAGQQFGLAQAPSLYELSQEGRR